MPSLLDVALHGGSSALLRQRMKQRSLLEGAQFDPPPSIFQPGQAPSVQSLVGSQQVAAPGAPPMPQGPGTPVRPQAPRPQIPGLQVPGGPSPEVVQTRQAVAAQIAKVAGGDVPPGALAWVEETARESAEGAGPGQTGRNFIARLFAGDKVPGLSEAANRQLLKQALFWAGLTMLGESAGGNNNFGQVLALGIMQGRRSITESAGALLDEQQAQQRTQERYQVLSGANGMSELERWTELRRRSTAEGDLESARVAHSVIEELRGLQTGEPDRKVNFLPDGRMVFSDETGGVWDADGNRLKAEDLAPPTPEVDPLQGSFREEVLQPDGTTHTVLFDRAGNPIRDLGPSKAAPPAEDAGGPETQVAETLRSEVSNIRRVLGDDPETEELEGADKFGLTGPFGRVARFRPRELQSTELQQMNAAAENILSLIVRARSGAQATDAEVERLRSFGIPQAGDKPETVATKLERLDKMVQDFQANGANAAVDSIMGIGGEDEEEDEDDILSQVFGPGGR